MSRVMSVSASLFALALASVALLSGCSDRCDGREVSFWTYTPVYGGSIDAPADLGLPAKIDRPNECGDSGGGCFQDGRCFLRVCVEIHQDASTSALVLDLHANEVTAPEAITLPSSVRDVTLEASIVASGTRVPLTVVSGSVTFAFLKANEFDVRLDLVLRTPDGRTVTVTNGRYGHLNGHTQTVCQS